MKVFKSLSLILCITMFVSISAIGNLKTECAPHPEDSLRFGFTPEEVKITRLIIEENSNLRQDVKNYKQIDSVQSLSIQSLEESLLNCEEQNLFFDSQLSKLEHISRYEVTESSEPWYENPFYVALGFVAGVLTGYFGIK